MRAVTFAVLVVLGFMASAHANMAPPGKKVIPREVRVEFAEPYPGYTFFVITLGRITRLPSTTGSVDLSQHVGYDYARLRMEFQLVAVPDDMLADVGGDDPKSEWFEKHTAHPRVRRTTFNPTIVEVPVTDSQERVIQNYRVKLTETAIELEGVSETVVEDSSSFAVGLVGGAVAVAGSIALVLWFIRRRNSVTRTGPPPGD